MTGPGVTAVVVRKNREAPDGRQRCQTRFNPRDEREGRGIMTHGMLFGCLAPGDPVVTATGAAEEVPALDAEAAERPTGIDPLGDAQEPLTAAHAQSVCTYVCAAAAAMECGYVSATCAAGTTITVGGMAIPCLWAMLATCGAAAGGVASCINLCTRVLTTR